MTKTPTKREIEKTFNFVLDELMRHGEISKDLEKLKQTVKQDGLLYELPFPNGMRHMIGKEAYVRLDKLANKIVLSDNRLTGRIRYENFRKVLTEALGKAILEKEEVEEKKFIENCIQIAVSRHLKPRDFFIPCIVSQHSLIKVFKIGPVTFYDKARFRAENFHRIQTSKFLEFSDFEDCYKVQNWIAHIRIDGFDQETAEERANLCVRLAIAAIKARLRRRLAQWLGTENQSMLGLKRYSLVSEPNDVDPQFIYMGLQQRAILNGYDSQVEHLFSLRSRAWFSLFGAFLEEISSNGQWSYLESKIVTALIWLDIGNSPVSDAERVFAFSTCLEALFVTKETGKKQQLVNRSLSIIKYSGWDTDLNTKMGEFYATRGDIVHGDVVPLNSEFARAANTGKYLTDVCIEGFLHFAHWLLIKHSSANTKEHELPFNGDGSFSKAIASELSFFVQELKRRDQDSKRH